MPEPCDDCLSRFNDPEDFYCADCGGCPHNCTCITEKQRKEYFQQRDPAHQRAEGRNVSGDYEAGRQPCAKYTPGIDGYGFPNVHECIFCRGGNGTVSFCENCNRDHHSDGYETCLRVGLPVGCGGVD